MIEKTISILGCGWLGLPLARLLLQKGYQVKGSTTTPAKLSTLSEAGIQPFLIDLNQELNPESITAFTQAADWLIVNIPPKIRKGEGAHYPEMFRNLIQHLVKNRPLKAIFISSTSVYPDLNKVVTETDTPTDLTENYILQAERVLQDFFGDNLTIIRFGGLMGPGRQPGKFLAGKTNVPNGAAPVNMIHLDDSLGIISETIARNCTGKTFNACADEHPDRKEFFTKAALNLGLIPPDFSAEPTTSFKIISSEILKKKLPYSFKYPDPLQAL